MFRPFKNSKEAEHLLGVEVTVEGEKAIFVQMREKNNCLYFVFEYEDGTAEILNSLSSFYVVRVNGKIFGYEDN